MVPRSSVQGRPTQMARSEVDPGQGNAASVAAVAPGVFSVKVSGRWALQHDFAKSHDVERHIAQETVRRLIVDASGLAEWDSAFVSFVAKLKTLCTARSIEIDLETVPSGARRLVRASRYHSP